MSNRFILLTLLTVLSLLQSCDKKTADTTSTDTDGGTSANYIETADEAMWQLIEEKTVLIKAQSETLAASIDIFLKNPNPETLFVSQQAWLRLNQTDGQLHAIKLLARNTGAIFDDLIAGLSRISSQPIQEGYLDRFGPYPYSGLVYDIGVPLTHESLIHQHQLTGEEEIVLGIYAIEFMLFGENSKRSANDYEAKIQLDEKAREAGLNDVNELPENRRRRLLKLQSNILVSDINSLLKSGRNNANNSVKNAWLTLTNQEKVSAVRNTLQQTLTQALIELSILEKQINDKNEELPSTPDPTLEQKTQSLRLRLQSVQALALYLSPTEKDTLISAATESDSLLHADKLQKMSSEDRKQAIKALYNKLQSLI